MQIDGLIRNYYEKLVMDEILQQKEFISFDDDDWVDVGCVALNQLPARYYRHSVDMAFYLSGEEHQQMEDKVTLAVQIGIRVVKESK